MILPLKDEFKSMKNCEIRSGLSKQGQAASEKYIISSRLCMIATGYRDFIPCQDYLDNWLCYVMFPMLCYPGCSMPSTTTLLLEASFLPDFSLPTQKKIYPFCHLLHPVN
ncbi:uncharacterized protein LOC125038007 [Penaeus chinensis]|uniref:uncharacterized protein LOC125038007 n=1 Tax=Penaeus chinensis TaxID=139456 RepID=UPI001FB77869|nr:uncharacterized protein LOC125038007 [Penaeus chinensis]